MRGLMFGVAGSIIGFGMGVAAFGAAVNGAVVFGPIGFIIGWLVPSRSPVATTALTSPMAAPETAADCMVPQAGAPPAVPTIPQSELQRIEASLNEMVPIASRIAASIWNMQMKVLIAVGVMPFLVQRPWLLFAIAFALLAVVFPLGIVFTVTGMAAMHFDAKPEDRFLVDLIRKA